MAQVIKNADADMFVFQLDGEDETHSLPIASSLPLWLIRLFTKDHTEFVFALIDKYCPELAERDDVKMGTLQNIIAAWDAASAEDGADLGKSRASSRR